MMAIECLKELPDDVLSLISSSLGLRDAVRLGFLLFGRKQLWKSLTNLNFSFPSLFGFDFPSCVPEKEYSDKLSERRCKFVTAVDAFLEHHVGVRAETFSVDFTFGETDVCPLNQWLRFALASGCKELNLNLKEVAVPFRFIFVDFCEFPLKLAAGGQASSITRLSLSSCLLRPPRDFNGFSHIKVLRLHIVSIVETDLHELLSKCFTLEHLTLSWCFWWDYLSIFNPSAHLKYLEVRGCDGLLKIEISAANLTTFEYKGPRETRLIVKNAPHLVRASIRVYPTFENHEDDIVSGLSSNLPQLRTLFLHFNPMDEVRLFNFRKFTNLKNLVVNAATVLSKDFMWPVVLLNAAPIVEKFQLNVFSIVLFFHSPTSLSPMFGCLLAYHPGNDTTVRMQLHPGDEVETFVKGREIKGEREKPPRCPHYHLKEVEINGYSGCMHQIELVMYIFSNATCLNSMIIDPRQKYYIGDHEWRYLSCSREARTYCMKSSHILLSQVPAGVKLVIL